MKTTLLALAVLLVLGGWFFRYEVIPSVNPQLIVVHDRVTGKSYLEVIDYRE